MTVTDLAELDALLTRVVYDASLNYVNGLNAFRNLLAKDVEEQVLAFLRREMPNLEGQRRGGIAFVLAEHYRQSGDLPALRHLYATDDACVRQYVLNALWGQPDASAEMGPGIVQMALTAAVDPAPDVRTEACSVLQNQCAWGVDVAGGVNALGILLADPEARVRQQAAYAVGNLAKHKYDLSGLVLPLAYNLAYTNMYARESSAWALWQISRSKQDIDAAIPALARLLTDTTEYHSLRTNAAGALLHHARKSDVHRRQVQQQVSDVSLDTQRKEIRRFVEQLTVLG